MQWLMYELSKRPEAQQKAREEAIRIGGGDNVLRAPDFDDYNNMDYIHGCVMECLRLHPPVVSMVKTCAKSTKIGKTSIPKGSCIYVNAKACHLYGEDFNTTEFTGAQFAPERFLDKDFKQKVQTSGAWFPFNMSNRKCIGYMFAQIELCIMLCRMLQFYEFKLLNDESKPAEKVEDLPGITFRPSSNLKVLVTRRTK
ncbi:predicted protein [Naegleria gruberi]|uniref:Predicted protein n=1 Tax=Naegleria gruberi TaxID=5762 RepID=D2VWA1_NAEGR|nr:uncharacterized protein NAEGRDRAFT_73308 [Naegleria gruberi]EFC38795.1 predicted protein [Naegleria gruberi]|eukprot:XP_002671539.1 predicted protein [Naegleria gruberi strain NEG-M]